MTPYVQKQRLRALKLHTLLVFAFLCIGACGGGSPPVNSCPDAQKHKLGATDNLCSCQDDNDRYVQDDWSCGKCDSQGSPNQNRQFGVDLACRCSDDTYLDGYKTNCKACPTNCKASGAECVPDGCEKACGGTKACKSGSRCKADGTCAVCETGQCGGGCGPCPSGLLCLRGSCIPALRCVLPKQLSDGTKWCLIDVSWTLNAGAGVPPAGSPCCCSAVVPIGVCGVQCYPYQCCYVPGCAEQGAQGFLSL